MSDEIKFYLRAMARHFELNTKSVEFWINQTQLSEKKKPLMPVKRGGRVN